MPNDDSTDRDKFVASLSHVRAVIRRRRMLRAATEYGTIALVSSACVQLGLALLAHFTSEPGLVLDAHMACVVWGAPLMVIALSMMVAALPRVSSESAARWTDSILGGDTVTTALNAKGPFESALVERAVHKLAALPQFPSLRIGRRLGVALVFVFLGGIGVLVHAFAIAPSALNVDDERVLRLDPLEAAEGLLVDSGAADAARALGLEETAVAMEQAGALGELLEAGGLSDSEALAQLASIEELMSGEEGLSSLEALLGNGNLQEQIEAFRESGIQLPEGGEVDASSLAALAGLLNVDDEVRPMLESALESPLLRSLLRGEASTQEVAEVMDARKTLQTQAKQLRQQILARSRGTHEGLPSTIEGSETTRRTSGHNVRVVDNDASAAIERLPREFRDAASRYLSSKE